MDAYQIDEHLEHPTIPGGSTPEGARGPWELLLVALIAIGALLALRANWPELRGDQALLRRATPSFESR